MAKVSRPVLYVGIGAVAVAAWFFANGGSTPRSSRTRTATPRSAKAAQDLFTPEDRTARFAALNEKPRNAFMPVVARSMGSSALGLAANSVPAELAEGDANWVYTGTAIVDEAPTALLENRVSFEGEFVKQGQKWKHATIARIAPGSLTLSSPNGKQYVLRLVDPFVEEQPQGIGLRPVNPALSGPIAIQPQAAGRRADRGQNPETRNAN